MKHALAEIRNSGILVISTILSMLFVTGSISANTAGKRSDESLSKKWAIQFEINQDFDLSSFEGGTLSLKRITSPGRAWRLGLDLGIGGSDFDDLDFRGDTLYTTGEGDNDHYAFTLSLYRVFDTAPSDKLKFFYGFGPNWGYSYTKSTSRSVNTGGDWMKTQNKTKSWNVGIGGILGVEWFFADNMSLLGEYGSTLRYQWNKATRVTTYSYTYNRADERTTKTWEFDAEAVKFGLSAYF